MGRAIPRRDLERERQCERPSTMESYYQACLDMNLRWTKEQVTEIDQMWNIGVPVWVMAQSFDRDPDEVAILLMDRLRKGILPRRAGGVYGKEMNANARA